ncbi:MAG: hypothetical protein AB8B92_05380 [Gammaproteobacteria bacterium]
MSDIEQPVRLALQSHSICGSEPKKIHSNYVNDQEEFAVVRCTPLLTQNINPECKPRAAVFISKK